MKRLKGHRGDVYAVLVFQKWIFSAGYDRTIRVWDVSNGKYLRSMVGHSSIIRSLTSLPPKMAIASASWDNTVKVWNVRSGSLLASLDGHTNRVKDVIFCNISRRLGVLVSGGDDCTIKFWDCDNYSTIASSNCHSQPVLCLAVSEDTSCHLLASGSADCSIHLYRLGCSEDGTFSQSFVHSSHLQLSGHEAPVTGIVFSKRGNEALYSCGEDMAIFIWDCNTACILKKLAAHSRPCQSLCVISCCLTGRTNSVAPEPSEYLISTSLDGTVRVWNTESGNEQEKMAFSGSYIFNASVGVKSEENSSYDTLVISGDDGMLHMYPNFTKEFGGKKTQPSLPTRNVGDISRRNKRSDALPAIGSKNNAKTLLLKLPGEQVHAEESHGESTNYHAPNNLFSSKIESSAAQDPPRKILSKDSFGNFEGFSSRPSREFQGGAEWNDKTDGGIIERFGAPLADEISKSSVHRLSSPSRDVWASRPKRSAIQRKKQENNHRKSRLSYDEAGLRHHYVKHGKASKRPGKHLPTLQTKKEFICVKSQYTEPPAPLSGVGMLNCSSMLPNS